MITVAVCDDEKFMREHLEKMVKGFFHRENLEITVLQFGSGEELLKCSRPIDVLFLDIQMKPMDGMETAVKMRERHFKGFLIFITVLEGAVYRAFEVQAFDYLIKPVEEHRFDRLMQRLVSFLKSEKGAVLFIRKGNSCAIVPFDDIVFCEVMDRKVYVHLSSSEILDYYDKIQNLELKLDRRFFRCHRSFVINLKYLKSYENRTAYMSNGTAVPVSRLRSQEFSDVVLQYMTDRK